MDKQLKKELLVRTLDNIVMYCQGHAIIDSPEEFTKLHSQIIQMLAEMSELENNEYYINKSRQYPILNELEIKYHFDKKDGGSYRASSGGITGILLNILIFLFQIKKYKGNNLSDIKTKFSTIIDINLEIINVLRNPGMEELYREAKKI